MRFPKAWSRSDDGYGALVKALVIGCGRLGSAVAKHLASEDWAVTCLDHDEASLARLEPWRGAFVVGHALDLGVLAEAQIEDADAVVVATGGDNTNVVLGQVIQRRWSPATLVVRVKDPARAAFFAARGLMTVSPTQASIDATLTELHRQVRG